MKTTSITVRGLFPQGYEPSTPGAVAHGVTSTIIGGVDFGATIGCVAVVRACRAVAYTLRAGFDSMFTRRQPVAAAPGNSRTSRRTSVRSRR